MKFCKDCVHFRVEEQFQCHLPYLCPVDGKIYDDAPPLDAYEFRGLDGCCGPDGRYWQAKGE